MLVPVNWLKEYVDIDIDTKDLADKMTMSGSKVEAVEAFGQGIENVVIGKIDRIEPHPNADKLVIVAVDVGNKKIQVVTGAKNIREGDYVPVALVGAKLPGGLKIEKTDFRGEVSEGMLCSHEELGIGKSMIPEEMKDGIWILDQPYPLGEDIKDILYLRDDIIEFEITSNRPDCLSMIGMARETAATLRKRVRYPEIKVTEIDEKSNDKVTVRIDDQDGCLRYVARVVKDVKIEPSPLWMQQKLIKAGVRPINNIVDITNYVMLEYGQPLHAFDMDKVEGNQIIVRRAENNEVLRTLDGVDRKLTDIMTVIADTKKALGIAGVMGGEESEITSNTKYILLESANFSKERIRQTSKKLGLRTEASSRFEKGLDPNMAEIAANRVCQLVEELGAGKILKGAVDVFPVKKEATKIIIRPNRINSLLGTELTSAEMVDMLKLLEISAECSGEDIEVTVPTFRPDLEQEADFAEEIGRIYGFDRITATMMKGNVVAGGKTYGQVIEDVTKDILTAMGFNEVLTYSFVSPRSIDKIRLGEDSIKRNFVKLLNPLGDETSVMRTSLLPNILDVLARNQNRKVEGARAFEMGKIFIPKPESSGELPYEIPNLVMGMYGDEEDFYTLKGAVETLLNRLGVLGCEFEVEKYHPAFHPGRCANIMYGSHTIGTLGEIHPAVMDNYDIDERCYCAEIDYDILLRLIRIDKIYKPLPKYPAITRDFAIVVRDNVYVREIEKIIREHGGEILESYKLFDVYTGNQIPEGYKSVAYTLTYRHRERTLMDEEVNKVNEEIIATIERQLGGKLRE